LHYSVGAVIIRAANDTTNKFGCQSQSLLFPHTIKRIHIYEYTLKGHTMEQHILTDPSVFDEVWERVTADSDSADDYADSTEPATVHSSETTIPTTIIPRSMIMAATKSSSSAASSAAAASTPATGVTSSALSQGISPAVLDLADASALISLIDNLFYAKMLCCTLSKKCSGSLGKTSSQIVQYLDTLLRSFQAQYFILTELRYYPGGTFSYPSTTGDYLRTLLLVLNTIQKDMASLASSTTSPSLARLCLCSERDTAKIVCLCEKLLVNCSRF